MRVYVASSWKTERQPSVVAALRAMGHEVYDFRDEGFLWGSIDPGWESWSTEQFREALEHPLARLGFDRDIEALQEADVCVLVNPSGRSAHLELGHAIGAGLFTVVILAPDERPDLMYRAANVLIDDVADLERVMPVVVP